MTTDKLQRLRQSLKEEQLEGLLLTRRDNIAWLTEGASFYVVDRAETGVASLLITATSVTLIAPENELPRILAEEPLPFKVTLRSYPWYHSLTTALTEISPGQLGSDMPVANARDMQASLVRWRSGLNPAECERFVQLGKEVALIVESVARGVRPGMSERAVEASLYATCLPRGIRPVCTLIAADQRISQYKHPVPGPAPLQRQMLITLGAERDGLNVSITRMLHLGEPSVYSRQHLRTLAEIHADILAVSQPGHRWEDIFRAIKASYARHGFPDGWRQHHQGGPAGYGCRDFIVTDKTPGKVVENQALAWNPTLPGVKSEETVLLTVTGLQRLTDTGKWPTITVNRGENVWQFADWLVIEP